MKHLHLAQQHIPNGIYTFKEFKEKFTNAVQEKDFKPNIWEEVIFIEPNHVGEMPYNVKRIVIRPNFPSFIVVYCNK